MKIDDSEGNDLVTADSRPKKSGSPYAIASIVTLIVSAILVFRTLDLLNSGGYGGVYGAALVAMGIAVLASIVVWMLAVISVFRIEPLRFLSAFLALGLPVALALPLYV